MDSLKRSPRRHAMTLLELMVVLVILIALAAILVPMLPNMLSRAHTAAAATNVSEINKFVQTYEQLYQGFPQDLDNLAGTAAAPVDYLPGAGVAGLFTVRVPAAQEVAALTNAGVTRVAPLHSTRADLATNGGSPTFNPYNAAAGVPVSTSLPMTFVGEAFVEGTASSTPSIVRDDPTRIGDVYVVFGLGGRSSMIGKVITNAPTHFSDNEQTNAANAYGRFGLVFRVARGTVTGTPEYLPRAVFVGTVEFHETGIAGADSSIDEFYKITKAQ